MRTAAMVVGTVLLLGGLTACGPQSGATTEPRTERGSVSLEGQEVSLAESAELSVSVPSCNGDPDLADLDEQEGSVRIEVVTTQVVEGDSDACLDLLKVTLDEPLGDRDVVDTVSGDTLRLVGDPAGTVECFDADYPTEPTFETPEDALADALETGAADVPVPEDLDAYDRLDIDDGWVEFAFVGGEDHELTWGVTQDQDDRWGMTSLGGCVPVDP